MARSNRKYRRLTQGAGLTAYWGLTVCVHAAFLALLAIGLLALRPDVVLPRMQAVLHDAGYELEVEGMELSLSPLRITIRGLDLKSRDPGGLAVRLPRFEGSFSVLRGLQGGAWVRELHLEEPKVRAVLAPAAGKAGSPPDIEGLLALLDMDKAVISNGAVTIARQGTTLDIADLNVILRPDPAESVLQGNAQFSAHDPDHNATATGRVDVLLQGTPLAAAGTVRVADLSINHSRAGGSGAVEAGLTLSGDGLGLESLNANATLNRLEPVNRTGWHDLPVRIRYSAPEFEAHVGKIASVSGSLSGNLLGGAAMRVSGSVDSELALEGLRQLLPEPVRDLRFTGTVPFEASYGPQGYFVRATLGNLFAGLAGMNAKAELDGHIGAEGSFGQPIALAVEIRAEKVALDQPAFTVTNGSMAIEASGSPSNLKVSRLALSIPGGDYRLPALGSGLGKLSLESTLSVSDLQTVEVSSCSLVLDRVGRLQGDGSFDGQTVRAELKSDPLKLSGLIGLAPEGALAGWIAEGSVTLSASARGTLPRPVVEGEVAMNNLSLSSADGTILAMIDHSTLRLDRPDPDRYRARLTVDTGECLVDTVYLNFADQPLHAEVLAKPGPKLPAVEHGAVDLRLGELCRVEGEGIRLHLDDAAGYSGRFSLSSERLGELFTSFIKEPFSASHPGLREVSLDGQATLDLFLEGKGKRATVDGGLAVTRLHATSGESVELSGFTLTLPMSYRFGLDRKEFLPPKRPQNWGSLHIDRAVTPLGELTAIDLGVALVPNRLFVDGSVTVPVYGAQLSVRDVRVERPLSGDFQIAMQAALDRLDMKNLPTGTYRFDGHVAGDLGLVTVDRNRVNVSGGLSGAFYGGELKIENIMARQPFSSSRVVGADASIQGMDLKGFTSTLGAGLIFGRMNVDLDRFRLAYGQPVALELKAESVEVKGVDQEVSLKAVDTISVLGTGQGITSTAINIFRTFVQQFDYAAIGIACTLQNDVFKVNGLIRDNGVEYLVKKPPLFGINVINRNPNNKISFKDMMGRVERVLQKKDKPSAQDEHNKEAT